MATIINASTLATLKGNIQALLEDVNRTAKTMQGGGARKRTARRRTTRKRTTRRKSVARKRTARKRTVRRRA